MFTNYMKIKRTSILKRLSGIRHCANNMVKKLKNNLIINM